MPDDTWIFGYGSLIWRPDFPFVRAAPGVVEGYARRFYQGSPDHRGTPALPGRVVTLVEAPGARVVGRVFLLKPSDVDDVLRKLDVREQGGYVRQRVEVRALDGARRIAEAITFRATPDNPSWLGPAPAAAIARRVCEATGPSGSNREYVLRLAAALRDMGARCEHTFAVERALLALDDDGAG